LISIILIKSMNLTATDYILLAYLNSSALYAYRLNEILGDESVDSWCQYSIPHLYYSLRKLEKNGWAVSETKKVRSRPAQKIYSLTDKGKGAIEDVKNGTFLIEEKEYFQFDLLLGLAEKLGLEEQDLKRLTEKRIEFLRDLLAGVQADFREMELNDKKLSAGEQLAIKHRIRFLKSEIDFYRKSIKELK